MNYVVSLTQNYENYIVSVQRKYKTRQEQTLDIFQQADFLDLMNNKVFQIMLRVWGGKREILFRVGCLMSTKYTHKTTKSGARVACLFFRFEKLWHLMRWKTITALLKRQENNENNESFCKVWNLKIFSRAVQPFLTLNIVRVNSTQVCTKCSGNIFPQRASGRSTIISTACRLYEVCAERLSTADILLRCS